MRSLMAAAIVLVLAGSAYAQGLPPIGIPMGEEKPHKELPPEKEGDYRSAIKGLPDRKTSDPWGSVRSQAPAQSAQPAQPGKQTSAQAKKKSEKTDKSQ